MDNIYNYVRTTRTYIWSWNGKGILVLGQCTCKHISDSFCALKDAGSCGHCFAIFWVSWGTLLHVYNVEPTVKYTYFYLNRLHTFLRIVAGSQIASLIATGFEPYCHFDLLSTPTSILTNYKHFYSERKNSGISGIPTAQLFMQWYYTKS